MINETEYRQRVINHFAAGNPTEADWNFIGYLIFDENNQTVYMEQNMSEQRLDITDIIDLDERILTEEEFSELYMEEEEREERKEYERLKQKFAPVGSKKK